MVSSAFQGSLFSNAFIEGAIKDLPDWLSLTDADLGRVKDAIAGVFAGFPTDQTPNETHTEDDLIWRVLALLGWSETLRQQNLTTKGRDDVPDGVLFADEDAKRRAIERSEEWRRYEFGSAIIESKRWRRPLDRRSDQSHEVTAPSTQMLRYLRRVDDLTNGALRWGVLTNGARWRLYYSGLCPQNGRRVLPGWFYGHEHQLGSASELKKHLGTDLGTTTLGQ